MKVLLAVWLIVIAVIVFILVGAIGTVAWLAFTDVPADRGVMDQ